VSWEQEGTNDMTSLISKTNVPEYDLVVIGSAQRDRTEISELLIQEQTSLGSGWRSAVWDFCEQK
jgi:hypothetical protein